MPSPLLLSDNDNLSETKFLGIIINKQLKWVSHIEKNCGRINRFAFAVKCLYHLSDMSTMLTAFHAYIGSTILLNGEMAQT